MIVVLQGKKPVLYDGALGIYESGDISKSVSGSDFTISGHHLFQGGIKLGTYSRKTVAAKVLVELLEAEEAGAKVFYMPDAGEIFRRGGSADERKEK